MIALVKMKDNKYLHVRVLFSWRTLDCLDCHWYRFAWSSPYCPHLQEVTGLFPGNNNNNNYNNNNNNNNSDSNSDSNNDSYANANANANANATDTDTDTDTDNDNDNDRTAKHVKPSILNATLMFLAVKCHFLSKIRHVT